MEGNNSNDSVNLAVNLGEGADASPLTGSVPDIEWRKLLAITYCGFPALYCDDGELQDNRTHPSIDFKRDSVDEIWDKMRRRTTSALQSAVQPVDKIDNLSKKVDSGLCQPAVWISETLIRDEWVNHVNTDPSIHHWPEVLAFAKRIAAISANKGYRTGLEAGMQPPNAVERALDCSTPTSEQPREVLIQRLEACQQILADERAAQPDGWKLVPIEPTEAMLVAMDDAFTWQLADHGTTPVYYGPKEDRFADHKDAYRAMLAVAFKSGINPNSPQAT